MGCAHLRLEADELRGIVQDHLGAGARSGQFLA